MLTAKLELEFEGGWGGGRFLVAGANKQQLSKIGIELPCDGSTINITKDGKLIDIATVEKVVKRYGQDSDHGHTYDWVGVDYTLHIPSDVVKRRTTILQLINEGYKLFVTSRLPEYQASQLNTLLEDIRLAKSMEEHINRDEDDLQIGLSALE